MFAYGELTNLTMTGSKTRKSSKRTTTQSGFGHMPIFHAHPLQRGYGFGGLFRGFLRSIAPIAKRGLLSVGKAALNAGARALEDVRDNNTSIKQALKKETINTFHPVNVINRAAKKRKASSQSTKSKGKVQRVVGVPKKKKKNISDAPRFSKN